MCIQLLQSRHQQTAEGGSRGRGDWWRSPGMQHRLSPGQGGCEGRATAGKVRVDRRLNMAFSMTISTTWSMTSCWENKPGYLSCFFFFAFAPVWSHVPLHAANFNETADVLQCGTLSKARGGNWPGKLASHVTQDPSQDVGLFSCYIRLVQPKFFSRSRYSHPGRGPPYAKVGDARPRGHGRRRPVVCS